MQAVLAALLPVFVLIVMGLVYNTKEASKPASYQDLLNPKYKGRVGIPTYGMSGMFSTAGETNAHGLNEKIRVKSLYEGREFLESIVRAYVK